MLAMGLPPIMSMDAGPIAPLGKRPNFDHEFDVILEKVGPAIDDGLVEIVSPSKPLSGLTIGAVPMEDDSPNPQFVFQVYRLLAADLDFLSAAMPDPSEFSGLTDDQVADLAPTGSGHGKVSTCPDIASIQNGTFPSEQQQIAVRIACARIAALIKVLSYSHFNSADPICDSSYFMGLIHGLENNASQVFGEIPTEGHDGHHLTQRLFRLQAISIREQLPGKQLDELSIDQILSYRSKHWKNTINDRVNLSCRLREIAIDVEEVEQFHDIVKKEFDTYASKREELLHRWTNVRIRIACELGALMSANYAGIQENFFSLGSLEHLMLMGAVFFKQASSHIPTIRDLMRDECKLSSSLGYCMNRPYQNLTVGR